MKKKVSLEKRRNALKKGAGFLGITLAGASFQLAVTGCENPFKPKDEEIDRTIKLNVTDEQALSVSGGSVKKNYANLNNGVAVIIARQADNGDEKHFKVFSSACTHRDCELTLPDSDREDFHCLGPCAHGAIFSFATGEVLKGPAKTPLPSFSASYDPATDILSITPDEV